MAYKDKPIDENYKRKDGKNAGKFERTVTYDKVCNICVANLVLVEIK